MNATLPVDNKESLDTLMLSLARNMAMDMYDLEDILKQLEIPMVVFNKIKDHPRFISYLRSEKDAWNAATNTAERTKLKAAVVMEEYMKQAYLDLHEKKTPLNQRVELGKLLAKVAGMGETKPIAGSGGGVGFSLQINISPSSAPVVINSQKTIDHDNTAFGNYAIDDTDDE